MAIAFLGDMKAISARSSLRSLLAQEQILAQTTISMKTVIPIVLKIDATVSPTV